MSDLLHLRNQVVTDSDQVTVLFSLLLNHILQRWDVHLPRFHVAS